MMSQKGKKYNIYTLYFKDFHTFPNKDLLSVCKCNGGRSDLAPFFMPQKQDHFWTDKISEGLKPPVMHMKLVQAAHP